MELRAGYKQTEVGAIPEDWGVKVLAEVCRQIVDGTHFTPTYTRDGVPFYSVENVTADDFENVKFISIKDHELQNTRCNPEKGDILMTRIGSLGETRIIDWDVQASIYVSLALLKVGKDLSPLFLYAYSRSQVFRQCVEKRSLMSAVPKKINMGAIGDVPVPVPPTAAEQHAIAAALSDADALIASLDALIAKKCNLKQAAMQQLLTGKKRLPGFTGKWEPRSLGSISAFITKGATPTTYGFDWQSHGVLFLRSECVSDRGLDLSQSMFISEAAHKVLKRGEACSGDLLITITGNVGRVIRLEDDFGVANINQHIARIRVTSEHANGSYVYHQLSHPKYLKYFNSIVTGQAYPQISLKQVREAIVLFPSVNEQAAIAEVMSDMDIELATLQAQRDKARAVKQGMMQELLTGRIRLV